MLTWRKVGLDLANSSCLILALLLRYGNRKVFRTTLHQERRMEATISTVDTAQPQQRTTKDYKSPPHALIWFFRKSRDQWKRKHQELQRTLKQRKNRVADVTKSREQWKLKAEQANDQLTALKAENDSLRTQNATSAGKKTTRTSTG
jgi:septal ring factor EnvC (AmiA/AmiB activator)